MYEEDESLRLTGRTGRITLYVVYWPKASHFHSGHGAVLREQCVGQAEDDEAQDSDSSPQYAAIAPFWHEIQRTWRIIPLLNTCCIELSDPLCGFCQRSRRTPVSRIRIMTKKKQSKFDFEQALEDLEELVTSMEEGELSLEESLQAFEKGIKLTRVCQTALKNAEQKVQVLLNENGDTQEIDLEEVED